MNTDKISPNTAPSSERSNMTIWVTAGRCREYMASFSDSMLTSPDYWRSFPSDKDWGDHLSGTVFRAAISEAEDDDLVDLFPLYVDLVFQKYQRDNLYIPEYEGDRYQYIVKLASEVLNQIDFEDGEDPLTAWADAIAQRREGPKELPV